LACASAGAVTAFLFTMRYMERRLDTAYDQGWRAAQAWYPPAAVQPPQWVPVPASAGAQMALPAPEAALETLPALPAVHHEGRRRGRPSEPPLRLADLEALARVRAAFAEIRQGLGLPL
jgi:hypothetical protein